MRIFSIIRGVLFMVTLRRSKIARVSIKHKIFRWSWSLPPDITRDQPKLRSDISKHWRQNTKQRFWSNIKWQTGTMVQQAAQVKFTILTTILQAGMAVVFGIMVRCVGGERKILIIKSYWLLTENIEHFLHIRLSVSLDMTNLQTPLTLQIGLRMMISMQS